MITKTIRETGYIAMLTVVILGVVVTVITTSIVLLGLGHTRSSLSENQSSIAKSMADTCAEIALKQIRLNPAFTGSGNLSLSGATCNYTVISAVTSSISSTGVSGNSTRRVTIDLSSRVPSIVFTKWQEN